MSFVAMGLVWKFSRSKGTDRLVLLALADRAGDDMVCWPGKKDIAKRCCISTRTVQRSIKALQELEEIEVDPRSGKKANGGQTNRYRITITPETTCLWETNRDDLGDTGVSAPGDRRVSHPETTVSPKPSVNHQKKSSQQPCASRSAPPARRGGGEVFSEDSDLRSAPPAARDSEEIVLESSSVATRQNGAKPHPPSAAQPPAQEIDQHQARDKFRTRMLMNMVMEMRAWWEDESESVLKLTVAKGKSLQELFDGMTYQQGLNLVGLLPVAWDTREEILEYERHKEAGKEAFKWQAGFHCKHSWPLSSLPNNWSEILEYCTQLFQRRPDLADEEGCVGYFKKRWHEIAPTVASEVGYGLPDSGRGSAESDEGEKDDDTETGDEGDDLLVDEDRYLAAVAGQRDDNDDSCK